MSKHQKNHSATEHKAEGSKKESKSESKILGFELNTILLVAALVILTALVSTWAGFSLAQSNVPTQNVVVNTVDSTLLTKEVETYINANLLAQQGVSAKIIGAKEITTGLYEMPFEIYQDGAVVSQGNVYSTKEKLFLVQAAFDLNTPVEQPPSVEREEDVPVNTQELTDEEISEVISFNKCLASKGIIVYGANWCGYTKNLVQSLGGFDLIEPIYVECTQEEELCNKNKITGYPTVTLNGVVINPDRSFEGFAKVTDCVAPKISQKLADSATVGSC